MKRQGLSVDRILLFFIMCLCFSDHSSRANNIAAASNIACSRDHPGHIKCRAIEADCYHSSTSRDEYKCLCSEGYWMLEGKCRKSDWCADGETGDLVCKSNGTVCKTLDWTSEDHTKQPYKCQCESRVVQSRICSVTDFYCQQKGATYYRHENITICQCNRNSSFDYSTSKCQSLDLCPFKKCTGRYETCQGSECVCRTGYERTGNQCKPRNYCISNDVCGSAKCEEGPQDDPKRIRCYCDSGYVLARDGTVPYCKLIRCETHSLNPCDHICLYSADKTSSHCACLPGHTLKSDGITCEIQASSKCAYNVCSSKSICVKLNGTEQCMCKNSLVGEAQTCLDRCAAGVLRGTCPGQCKSTEDGFQCICEGKYRLSKNQVTCEEHQMCVQGEQGLLNCTKQNRTCTESPQTEDGFTCGECLPGLQEHDGNCTDLCEVDENKRYCEEKGATCSSVNEVTREVNCKCPPLLSWNKIQGCMFARHSYTGTLRIFNSYKTDNSNETLRYGEGKIDWKKLDHDIGKSMSALFGQALSQVNVLQCRSDQADENHEVCIVCMIELQLHFEDYGILQRLNAHSVCRGSTSVPQMFCFFPPYLRLVPRHPTINNIDVPFRRSNVCGSPYGSSVCPASTECVPEDVGFSCRCRKGFVAKRTMFLNKDQTGLIEVCQDVNECEMRDSCPSGTICINTIGDFECRCEPFLFRWHNTGDTKVDNCTEPCGQVNCIHGECEKHDQGFYCRCRSGYTGLLCGERIPGYEDRPTTGVGHTAILAVGIVEAIIFVAFVVFAVIFYRYRTRRKPKSNTRNDAPPMAANIRKPTIDHIHMRNTPQGNGDFRLPAEEDPDEPIYADCAQIR